MTACGPAREARQHGSNPRHERCIYSRIPARFAGRYDPQQKGYRLLPVGGGIPRTRRGQLAMPNHLSAVSRIPGRSERRKPPISLNASPYRGRAEGRPRVSPIIRYGLRLHPLRFQQLKMEDLRPQAGFRACGAWCPIFYLWSTGKQPV